MIRYRKRFMSNHSRSKNHIRHRLLQLLFTLPYLKIELLEKFGIAHGQTASVWLKKLSLANTLHAKKIGRKLIC